MIEWIVDWLYVTIVDCAASVSGQLAECPPSDPPTTLAFTPDIPDSYLDHATAASFSADLTTAQRNVLYFFKLPPLLSADSQCGATMILEYCYWTTRLQRMKLKIFDFLYATQNELQFTVTRNVAVKSAPKNGICTFVSDRRYMCCDTKTLSRSRFGESSSSLAYGVRISSARPLAFSDEALIQVEQYTYTIPPAGIKGRTMFNTRSVNAAPPLLRLSQGRCNGASRHYHSYYSWERSCGLESAEKVLEMLCSKTCTHYTHNYIILYYRSAMKTPVHHGLVIVMLLLGGTVA